MESNTYDHFSSPANLAARKCGAIHTFLRQKKRKKSISQVETKRGGNHHGPSAIPTSVENGRNIPVLTRFVFYFCPSVSVFVGSYFRIYGSKNEVSPSVSEKSRFYMELIRIYSVFHPVSNLHKICLKLICSKTYQSLSMYVNMLTHGILVNIRLITSYVYIIL